MKILLVGVNAKYIHSSLAIRYIRNYLNTENVSISEYTINDTIENVLSDIYEQQPSVVAFSCYIWNISFITCIASALKKVLPNIIIIAGGPEVSYETVDFLKSHNAFDAIIRGEGEAIFKELLNSCFNFKNVLGVTYRDGENIVKNDDFPLINDLNTIPFPYSKDDIKKLDGKIIYYETSRGCPFNCSYCLSSTIHGVRYFDLGRVKKELQFFIDNDVKLVKFVDRTFNANKKRTLDIWKYLVDNCKRHCTHQSVQ